MRILFLLTQDLESPAGLGRYFPLARALAKRGHQVKIAALHSNWDGITERCFERDGVWVEYVAPMHVLKSGSQKIYYSPLKLIGIVLKASWALTQAALSYQADVIQVGKPHPMNSLAGIIANFMRGTPLCVDCDDLEVANLRFGGSWQQAGVRFFENLTLHRADHVTAHTEYLRNYLNQHGVGPDRFTYLPHGADFDRFAQIDQASVEHIQSELGLVGREVVAYIGSLSLRSHPVDLLLEAFKIVHAARPQAVLLIVGGGEDYSALVDMARKLNLEPAVIFRGRVPADQVPLYYRLAKMQVEPVRDNEVGRSSLPVKMFESWVSGVPFITGDVGDRRSVMGVPQAGLVCQPDDPEPIAEAILQILEDEGLASILRERGLERAKEYAWEHLAQKIERVYEQVVASRHGHH